MKSLYIESNDPFLCRAIEEHLFVGSHEDFFLVYICRPSVVIGAYQNVFSEADLKFCGENGIDVLRRISGGGRVYHDHGNINYAFIENLSGIGADYKYFIEKITAVLNRMGIPAYMDKICDIALSSYKISGSAQKISKNRVLHHGTLLYDTDIEMLKRSSTVDRSFFLSKATDSAVCTVGNVKSLCGIGQNTEDFSHSFFEGVSDSVGAELISLPGNEGINRLYDEYKGSKGLYSANPLFGYSRDGFSVTSKKGITLACSDDSLVGRPTFCPEIIDKMYK